MTIPDLPPVMAILALAYSAYLLSAAAGVSLIVWLVYKDRKNHGNDEAQKPQAGEYPEHAPPD